MSEEAVFIELDPENFAEAHEDALAPEGRYDVEVFRAEYSEKENGRRSLALSIRFTDPDDQAKYGMFTHFLNLPTPKPLEGQSAEKHRNMNRLCGRDVKRFVVQFGVPYDENGLNTADCVGCQAEAKVIVDGDYNSLQLDRLPKGDGEAEEEKKPSGGSGRRLQRRKAA